MPSPEVLSWVLSGALFVITCVGGALYKMLREEAKDHSDRIEKKASMERLSEVEQYLTKLLEKAERDNKDLIKEVKETHNRDIHALTTRLSEAIKSVESNVLDKMELMISAINNRSSN